MSSGYYFAYGSNMDEYQMSNRCPGAKIAGMGRLEGYRFLINSRGVATIVPAPGHEVRGVIWMLNKEHERSLDGYEGVQYGTYNKVTLKITLEDGQLVFALFYIAKDSQPGRPRPGYLEKIVRAAQDNKIGSEYLSELAGFQNA